MTAHPVDPRVGNVRNDEPQPLRTVGAVRRTRPDRISAKTSACDRGSGHQIPSHLINLILLLRWLGFGVHRGVTEAQN